MVLFYFPHVFTPAVASMGFHPQLFKLSGRRSPWVLQEESLGALFGPHQGQIQQYWL